MTANKGALILFVIKRTPFSVLYIKLLSYYKIYVEVKQTGTQFGGAENESTLTVSTGGTNACCITGVADGILEFSLFNPCPNCLYLEPVIGD